MLHQRAAFFFQHAFTHFDPMIQKISVADLEVRSYCAGAFVRRAVDQTSNTCLDQSARAHRTRFDRRVNINACKPVITEFTGGLAQGDDFRVRSGIAVGAGAVSGDGDELIAADNASADRHLTAAFCLLSRGQCLPHPVLINVSFRGSIH